MIIDGKALANTVYEKLAQAMVHFPRTPQLDIVIVGDNPVVERFVRIKESAAKKLNIAVVLHRFTDAITEEALKEEIVNIGKHDACDGVIVQLPLPSSMNVQAVLDVIPVNKDVDMLSTTGVALFRDEKALIIPPVAGAVKEILDSANIKVHGEEVLVLGFGQLVGKPVSILMRHNGAHVTVVDKPIADLALHVRDALVVISGTGSPSLVTKEMILGRHILIDAGTSESGGKLVGDIDPAAASVAALFTPVPNGVGPVTVAMLMRNLCILARARSEGK